MKKIIKPCIAACMLINLFALTPASASTKTDYFYDELNRLSAVIGFQPSGDNLSITSYSYDQIGNIMSRKSSSTIYISVSTGSITNLFAGTTYQLYITGILEDGTVIDLSRYATLISSNACVAELFAFGRINTPGAGIVEITATYGTFSGSVTLDIQGTLMQINTPYCPPGMSCKPIYFDGINKGEMIYFQDITVNQGEQYNLAATVLIDAGPALTMNCGGRADLKAVTEITLKPGFEALAGSTFEASILGAPQFCTIESLPQSPTAGN